MSLTTIRVKYSNYQTLKIKYVSNVSMKDTKIEYVYCMTNKSFNSNLVKIGWTTNEPTKRAQQLYTTDTIDEKDLEDTINDYKNSDDNYLSSNINLKVHTEIGDITALKKELRLLEDKCNELNVMTKIEIELSELLSKEFGY